MLILFIVFIFSIQTVFSCFKVIFTGIYDHKKVINVLDRFRYLYVTRRKDVMKNDCTMSTRQIVRIILFICDRVENMSRCSIILRSKAIFMLPMCNDLGDDVRYPGWPFDIRISSLKMKLYLSSNR